MFEINDPYFDFECQYTEENEEPSTHPSLMEKIKDHQKYEPCSFMMRETLEEKLFLINNPKWKIKYQKNRQFSEPDITVMNKLNVNAQGHIALEAENLIQTAELEGESAEQDINN